MREKIIQMVEENKIIAIVRGIDPNQGLMVAQALYEGGIRMIEVTFDQKDPIKQDNTVAMIRSIAEFFGERVAVGAGTVTSVELVERAAAAGAKYIISPDSKEDVIKRTRQLGLVSMPGALTPTEISSAHQWGADFVKLFPVGSLGAGYVKAVTAPLNHIKLLAVGGVTSENITQFLDAGCCGAGVGGNLVNRKWIESGEYEKLTTVAKELVAKVKDWRSKV